MRDEGDMLNQPRPLNCRAIILFAVGAWLFIYVLLTAALVLI